jgi:hypothetical protein
MRAETILKVTAIGLLGALVVQRVWETRSVVVVTNSAIWTNHPRTVAQAKNLSNLIVVGRVTNVRPGNLVAAIPGEPGQTATMPAEAITIQVQQTLRGQPVSSVQVFHTGRSTGDEAHPDASLEEDPPYAINQRYILLLTQGPKVVIQGVPVQTRAVISPEGRYQIVQRNGVDVLLPSTNRGFAGALRGKKVEVLENQL